MAKHDVRVKLQAEVAVKNVDVEIPVRIDGELRAGSRSARARSIGCRATGARRSRCRGAGSPS
jgi:hypothetical protein